MNVLRLTLRQLQIFLAVAERGSTTAASAELALSQSATSSAVAELERMLSLKLFDRSGKRLLLNGAGRALLPRARALLDGAADIERMARSADELLPALRIGASTTLGNYVLPSLLASFVAHQHLPATSWQQRVEIGNTALICARVAAFELDLGLIEGPCHEAALQVQPWLTDEMLIFAAPGSAIAARRARGAKVDIKALREAVWLLRESGSGTREASDQVLLPHLHSYRRSIELGSSAAIVQTAAAGLGIACLSRWIVAEAIGAGRLAALSTPLPRILRQCYWVIHRDKHRGTALTKFIEHLEQAAMKLTAGAMPSDLPVPRTRLRSRQS
jgi:DNA-binding transcriptional LysR family regulator